MRFSFKNGIGPWYETPPNNPPPSETPPVPKPAGGEKFPTTWEEVFQHQRFKELNTRATTAEAELQRIKTEQDKATGNWQKIAEDREKELNQERAERLKLKIGISKNLPAEIAELLKGDNEDELNAHADKLLSLVKTGTKEPKETKEAKETKPIKGIPPKSKDGSETAKTEATPEDIRKNAKEILKNAPAYVRDS